MSDWDDVLAAGPDKPIAEWTVEEYSRALEESGVREKNAARVKDRQEHVQDVLRKLGNG